MSGMGGEEAGASKVGVLWAEGRRVRGWLLIVTVKGFDIIEELVVVRMNYLLRRDRTIIGPIPFTHVI